MFSRILVPLDGSHPAEKALPDAEQMARLCDAPITLIQIIDLNQLDHYGLEEFVGSPGLADQLAAAEHAAKEYLSRIASELEQRGVRTTIELRGGNPARELVEAANGGDLIAMATHGRGGAVRLLLGSVAEAVLRHTSVPVLLIRAQTETAANGKVREDAASLLRHDTYRPEELARLLNVDVAVVRQAALSGRLQATIADHHVISITRTDALRWMAERG